MDKLLENLFSKRADELDALLDKRDDAAFDNAWVHLNQQVGEVDAHLDNKFDSKALFIKLSEATNCHEICCYITDDLELIEKARTMGLESRFLDYLKQSYRQGQVPCEWLG
ncbi:hypothetical protein [Shewanella algae]|uniref:hypothetical protein n=1 Tax=Shewanella algae TaxID=38313 RepID=UPI001BEF7478|nr:hypothetical protein [Shewanella algae]BCV32222.1 hypothetical protein TUM4442_17490 [Shewanella algae]